MRCNLPAGSDSNPSYADRTYATALVGPGGDDCTYVPRYTSRRLAKLSCRTGAVSSLLVVGDGSTQRAHFTELLLSSRAMGECERGSLHCQRGSLASDCCSDSCARKRSYTRRVRALKLSLSSASFPVHTILAFTRPECCLYLLRSFESGAKELRISETVTLTIEASLSVHASQVDPCPIFCCLSILRIGS